MDIVTLGEFLIDMFPAEVGRRLVDVSAFRPRPGGAPANVAVAAARLGASSAFIGKVGEDAFGRYLAEVLRREGVDTRGLRFDGEARTTMAFIAMPDENTAEFIFYRNPGADTRLRPEELDRSLLRGARAFHFGSVSLTTEPACSATLEAARVARSAGALVSFDVNYRPSLWNSPDEARAQIMGVLPVVNLLKVNEVELSLLAGEGEADGGELLRHGVDLGVVTRGPKGSSFHAASGSGSVPAFLVNTVDATGCGDAFIAGLLWRLVGGGNWRERLTESYLRESLRYANAVGALTAQALGVIPALPTAGQVDAFLNERGMKIGD